MMVTKFLVDANVLSETTRPVPDPAVVSWLERNEAAIAIDPIIESEIRRGVLRLPIGKKKAFLEAWLEVVVGSCQSIDWTRETARVWAELVVSLERRGLSVAIKDSQIAASALLHDLAVVTRNEKDFQKTGVRVVNPWMS